MKHTKKSPFSILALILALAALLLSALAFSGRPEDQSHLIDDLYQENHQLQERVDALEAQLAQLMAAVSLQNWTLDVTPWADSTGADVSLTATPSGYQPGISGTFFVMLEGRQVQSVPCLWDGTAFTATVSLNAADGYSYFFLLSSPTGTQQLPLTDPDAPESAVAVYLQSSLSAYCNLAIQDWTETSGVSLTLTDAYAQVQLPQVSAGGTVTIATADLVLRRNGTEASRIPIQLAPSEVAGSFDLTIADLQIPMPELASSDILELSLEVTLSDGRHLNAFGITWALEDGKLSSAVG